MKIVFFGTPTFAAHVLSQIIDDGIEVLAVISKPDRPKGRSRKPVPTPVKIIAQEKIPNVPIFQPEKVSADEFKVILAPYEADLFVVVAYGEIMKQHLLDMPKKGCINLHASLLPKYRGAAPIQRSIMNGESETGVTIMHMVRKMDAGDIIKTIRIPIGENATFGEIEKQLCEDGTKLLIEVIHDFEKNRISEVPQDEDLVTYAPKIELEECEIDWKMSAHEIHNMVRGVNPYPGAWCYVEVNGQKKRLKIYETRVVETEADQDYIISCGEGNLELITVQLEGKKAMNARDLFRGIRDLIFLDIA